MFRHLTSLLLARRASISIQCPSSIHPPHYIRVPTAPCVPPTSHLRRTFLTTTPTTKQQQPPGPGDPSSSPLPLNSLLPPPNFDDDEPDWTTTFSPPPNLPHEFGSNQYMHVDDGLKEHLRALLWQFRAPVRYAFAYGSGVFSQGTSTPTPMDKSRKKPMIDLIFGVTYTQHWHSINIAQHRDHYSFLGTLGSKVVAHVQDDFGAGVYFNPYVELNGTLIKYGVVNLSTLHRDLTDWDTLYLAGRLHKPVKILRDDPKIRYANQLNLLSALRTALLLLPETFTEQQLYTTISNISYTGDPRMHLFTENQNKVTNIVTNQLHNFRRLYSPLIDVLPNVDFSRASIGWSDSPQTTNLTQDMSPVRRANMVCRLPRAFRDRLYFQYQARYKIPRAEFESMVGLTEDAERMRRREGGGFERRIVEDGTDGGIRVEVGKAVKKTIGWASSVQSVKGVLTAGAGRSLRYLGEKVGKWKEGRRKQER
ncbi:mitochondrial matrix Mmp37-domain-containing protein [Terfezia claveryi]|nr:mitochondrial matrix Mmp37-domain-containing protein [Terfezia claveryi]